MPIGDCVASSRLVGIFLPIELYMTFVRRLTFGAPQLTEPMAGAMANERPAAQQPSSPAIQRPNDPATQRSTINAPHETTITNQWLECYFYVVIKITDLETHKAHSSIQLCQI